MFSIEIFRVQSSIFHCNYRFIYLFIYFKYPTLFCLVPVSLINSPFHTLLQFYLTVYMVYK